MGAVFNILLAFFLACMLSLFGYEVPDSQLTTKIGHVKDTVDRWNPLTEDEEAVPGPAKKAGLLPGDQIVAIDDALVEKTSWTSKAESSLEKDGLRYLLQFLIQSPKDLLISAFSVMVKTYP